MSDREIEWFQSTSSKVWGALSLALAAVVLVIAIVDGSAPVAIGAVLFGLLAYASMLRPKVGVTRDDLLIRNMYSSVRIPLPAIDAVVITRTFAARVLDKTYVSPAISRSFRQVVRGGKRPRKPEENYADHVEGRIDARIADARAMTGVAQGSDGQTALAGSVQRRWSVIELALLVVAVIALVVAIVV